MSRIRSQRYALQQRANTRQRRLALRREAAELQSAGKISEARERRVLERKGLASRLEEVKRKSAELEEIVRRLRHELQQESKEKHEAVRAVKKLEERWEKRHSTVASCAEEAEALGSVVYKELGECIGRQLARKDRLSCEPLKTLTCDELLNEQEPILVAFLTAATKPAHGTRFVFTVPRVIRPVAL